MEADGVSYKFVRTANTQTETDLSTGAATVCKVVWLDDCSYTLAFEKGFDPHDDSSMVSTIKITKIAGEYVYFDRYIKGGLVDSGKMQKVK